MSRTVFWTTKDGTKMNVDDMDDNHVRNAFKMLLRNINKLEQEAQAKRKREFLEPRGEMAQLMHEQMFDEEIEGMEEAFDPHWDLGNHVPPKIDY